MIIMIDAAVAVVVVVVVVVALIVTGNCYCFYVVVVAVVRNVSVTRLIKHHTHCQLSPFFLLPSYFMPPEHVSLFSLFSLTPPRTKA